MGRKVARPDRKATALSRPVQAVACATGGSTVTGASSVSEISNADAVLHNLNEIVGDPASRFRDSRGVGSPFKWEDTRPLESMDARSPDWSDTAPLDEITVAAPAPVAPAPGALPPTSPSSATSQATHVGPALRSPTPMTRQAPSPVSDRRIPSRVRLSFVGLVALACVVYVFRATERNDAAPLVAGSAEGTARSTAGVDPEIVLAPKGANPPGELPPLAAALAPPRPAIGRPSTNSAAEAAAAPSVAPPSDSADARPRIGLVGEAGDRASESLLSALRGDSSGPLPVQVDGVVAPDWPSTLRALQPQPRVALVRYDVLQAARRAPASMRLPPLEVLAPIAAEAICFVVRADSPLHTIHEIEDQPIDAGATRGARALTAAAVYRQMFGRAMPTLPARADASAEAALQGLRAPGSNQVVVVMASTMQAWLAASPSAARDVRLLRLDTREATRRGLFAGFLPLSADVGPLAPDVGGKETALGLLSFLVSVREPAATRAGHDRDMAAFARTLCSRLPNLRASSEAWRAVRPSLQLDVGHPYSAPAQAVLAGCDPGSQATLPPRPGGDPAVRG